MKKIFLLLLFAVIFSVSFQPTYAAGTDINDAYNELSELTGVSVKELRQNVKAVKGETSELEIILSVIQEVKMELADFEEVQTGEVTRSSSSSGGDADVSLRSGSLGYIFHTSATTVYNHGHVGIYTSRDYIAEAPGSGKTTRHTHRDNVMVVSDETSIMYVTSTTTAERQLAADWAQDIAESARPYRSNFAFNKYCDDDDNYNCSQLVWCAYKETLGIKLDSNGGFAVYPNNIKNSSRTNTIYTQ